MNEICKLTLAELDAVSGGRDMAKEKALIALWDAIHSLERTMNEPDPAPAYVSMKL